LFSKEDMGNGSSKPFTVALVLVNDFALMSYSAVIEPMRAANKLASEKLYHWINVPVDTGAATASSGAVIKADADLYTTAKLDLILVIAAGDPMSYENPPLFGWLRKMASRGVMIGGVSGGPVLLAKAGIMKGRRMTVHWEHAPALSEINPELLLSHTLYIRDRDRITCAGGVSPLDMMHSLLAEHHGETFARQVSDWFVHTNIRPAAGPTRAGIVERYNISNGTIVQVIEQMTNHLADPLSLSQFAMLVGRTTRQLNRLFSEYLGQTTMTFYRHLRLDHAKHLLTQTTLSITEIAFATGFSSGAHFSQSFKEKFGQPPSSFR